MPHPSTSCGPLWPPARAIRRCSSRQRPSVRRLGSGAKHEPDAFFFGDPWFRGLDLIQAPDGGVFVMSVPANPYRCPPGPYERASLIAHYFKTRKPRSKIIILDAKDVFSKQRLFQAAWAKLYPGMIDWIGQSAGGTFPVRAIAHRP